MEERERTSIPWSGALQSFQLEAITFSELLQKIDSSSQFQQAVTQCEQRIQYKKKTRCL